MANAVKVSAENIIDVFKKKLKNEWTRKVACQIQCAPLSCLCRRHVVEFDKVERWMKRAETSEDVKNVDLLLEALQSKMRSRRNSFDSKYILDRCVRVFCILLEHDKGELIDLFVDAGITDTHLHQHVPQKMESLRDILTQKGIRRVQEIMEEFQKARSAACPAVFKFQDVYDFEGGGYILPFCRYDPVNTKGGTARVYQAYIQTDLITDKELTKALAPSKWHDKDFGECYRIAIKSYSKDARDIYDWEKNAFAVLENDEAIPIVRYLGSYSLDIDVNGKDTPEQRRSYNIMLEYGEADLEEHCLDSSNVPPVRYEEIIRFWKSLFRIGDAIRTVHQGDVRWGKKHMGYDGWHADVKPDNILRVNGHFKLADFGFAKFVESGASNTVPTEVMTGGTDSFGAPEFWRSRNPGTLAPVTQRIDTWSLGCVLSVAATWVVLGFQGVHQYQILRTLAQGNQTADGKISDKFHNGQDVLPEIKSWHNYLRAHIRASDTVTEPVLELIETKMLQREWKDRLRSEEFSQTFGALLVAADYKHDMLINRATVREIDVVVKEALLAVEKMATAGEPGATPPTHIHIQTQTAGEKSGSLQVAALNASIHRSERVGKQELLQKVRLARTSHRLEALEEELDGKGAVSVSAEPETFLGLPPTLGKTPPSSIAHDNEDHNLASNDVIPVRPRKPMPRNPDYHPSSPRAHANPTTQGRETQVPQPNVAPPLAEQSRTRHRVQRQQMEHGNPSVPGSVIERQERNVDQPAPLDHEPQDMQAIGDRRNRSTQERPLSHSQPQQERRPPPYIAPEQSSGQSQPPPIINVVEPSGYDSVASVSEIGPDQPTPQSQRANSAFSAEYAVSSYSTEQAESNFRLPPSARSSDQTLPHSTDHRRAFSVPQGLRPSEERPTSTESYRDNPAVTAEHVYDLPLDVCHIRKDLEERKRKAKRKGRIGKLFGKKEEEDLFYRTLSGFIVDRDIVLVIDNGTTMTRFWPMVMFVAETLALQLIGLDEDGIDVRFTINRINGRKLDADELKREDGIKKLRQLLLDAQPFTTNPDHEHLTDMHKTLDSIFQKYPNPPPRPKATTLLVLTDGIWGGTDSTGKVEETIVNFARRLQKNNIKDRHFSISFVRFGIEGKLRLDHMDDRLCEENGLEDIIDAVSWRGKVRKMLLGSFVPREDSKTAEDDLDDPTPLYNLFDSFNKNEGPASPSGKVPTKSFTLSSTKSKRNSFWGGNSGYPG